ncbi:hypothetical protein FXO38_13467 [Capsicum annuum]|uniref:Uncharacterized protein n=1 Tax=Capsicum annuum TaxID=4072 RepID=A0A2G2ZP35_CAPAN|nr:hypothetical protein FXO38_13467 [Capsicum annuum]PHT83711.1 hypothetical protein T459_12154 [Capsicum annuum]
MKYGDFNSALKSEDRMGSPVTFSEIQGFQGMIDVMQITPLRSKGWHFAWCNKQEGNHRVYCKIDWDFGNYEWIQRFGHVEVEFLNPSVYYQSPVLISVCAYTSLHAKTFKLFTNVMTHPNFKATLQQYWTQDGVAFNMEAIWRKLKKVKHALKDINSYMATYSQKLQLARRQLDFVQHKL